MLRRALITGLIVGSIGMLSKPVSSRSFIKDTECTGFIPCIEKGNRVYTYNKIGIPVSFSKESAADMHSIYGINLLKTYQNMYGTQFYNTRKNVKYKTENWIKYTRITNDSRDKPYVWYVKV